MTVKTLTRRRFRFSLRTLFGVVTVFGVMLTIRAWLDPTNNRPFDRRAWLADPEHRAMLSDVMRHHLHLGMSREEVRQLLGKEKTSQFGSSYYVGHWQHDDDFLFVQYDSSNRLIEFKADGY